MLRLPKMARQHFQKPRQIYRKIEVRFVNEFNIMRQNGFYFFLILVLLYNNNFFLTLSPAFE